MLQPLFFMQTYPATIFYANTHIPPPAAMTLLLVSQTSYYGTLGLYLVSLPGLYSTITRAVKFKPIQKIYEAPGPAAGREVRQTGM